MDKIVAIRKALVKLGWTLGADGHLTARIHRDTTYRVRVGRGSVRMEVSKTTGLHDARREWARVAACPTRDAELLPDGRVSVGTAVLRRVLIVDMPEVRWSYGPNGPTATVVR